MKALDGRLQAAADFVTPGGRVADIGTDHGYLPVWLAGTGKISSAIAADINEGPLQSAAANIAAEGLAGKIETRLTDGLAGIDLSDVTDIVVAGMGGMLIAEILEKELPLAGKNLILQPMTQAPFLRRWLCENGFAILAETPAEAGGKFYTVLNARYDGEKREADSFFAHVGRMPEALADPGKAELARRYLAHQLKKLEVILFGMGQSEGARQTAAEYRALAEQIREVLA